MKRERTLPQLGLSYSLWAKLRYETMKTFIDWYKAQPCMDCAGQFDSVAMDFDHRNPVTKSFSIGKRSRNIAFHKVMDEMNQCDVVCANCHRVRTHK